MLSQLDAPRKESPSTGGASDGVLPKWNFHRVPGGVSILRYRESCQPPVGMWDWVRGLTFDPAYGRCMGAASSSYTVRNSFVGWSEWLSIRGLALGGCNSREKSTFYVCREPLLLALQCKERGMSRKLVDACRGRFRTSRHISTYIPTHPHRHAMHTFARSLYLLLRHPSVSLRPRPQGSRRSQLPQTHAGFFLGRRT